MSEQGGSEPRQAAKSEVSAWTARTTGRDEARWQTFSRWVVGDTLNATEIDVARSAARDLADDDERIRTIIGHCPKAIAVLDNDGNTLGFNRQFHTLFGVHARLGASIGELLDDADRALLGSVIRSAGTAQPAGATIRLSVEGVARDVEFLAATIPSAGAVSTGVVLVAEDRTALIAEEEERATTRASLVEADRAAVFGMTAAVALHDLANMITAAHFACGALVVARETRPSHDGTRDASALDDLQASLEQAVGILRGAQAAARPPAGDVTQSSLVGDVAGTVERLLRPNLRRARARMELRVAPGLEVAVARFELMQVLTNLIDNAAHAVEGSGNGTVVVSAARAPDVEGEVVIRVCDNGVGIEPGRLASVFDPYESSRKASGGTGLGLAIVRRIVESAGGRVQVASVPTHGTEFVIHLPAAKPRP